MAEQEVRIDIDPKMAEGKYSNFAVISHNENEFVLDFVFAHPPKGTVNARVITSPSHAKRLLKALQQNIDIYEKSFGIIKEGPEPPKMGFNISNN